jgi:DNA-binding LacI/PurR family transcriptional regulator
MVITSAGRAARSAGHLMVKTLTALDGRRNQYLPAQRTIQKQRYKNCETVMREHRLSPYEELILRIYIIDA